MNPAWRQRLRATTALQAVATAALLAAPLPAAAQLSPNARPTGGHVVAGVASIGQSTTTTTIDQTSQRAAVNWQGFDVGSQQTVQFQQPSSSAVTLNRVVGPNPSEIAGHIQANGQLVVVNQSGVVFDSGSQVNAAGLVVSAAGIGTGNFMAGKMVFDQAAHAGAKIENRGTITVKDHGLAALVAPQVRNSGTIAAKLGTVVLAGAEAEALDLYGDGLVSINVTKQVQSAPNGTKALVTNTGVVAAQGGTVVLTADAVDGVVQTLVDAGGKISANSTVGKTGTVLISGSGGDVRVEGAVSAQGKLAGTTGGSVMVSGSAGTLIGAKAQISASGQAGGGTIALGTTLARATGGSGTAAATTARLVVKKGAVVSADASVQGNGGRVALLSTNGTTMAGTVTVKGGAKGGNGGSVEISGGTVTLTGHVDASAPKGAIGTLLLDPSDLWVSDTKPSVATYTVTGGDLPTVPAGGAPNAATVSWVSPSLLASQNANIVLAATDNLYVASSYNTANTLNLGSYTLTLTGGTGLTVDRGFTINASSISLTSLTGPITLDGASGVSSGLITAPQLAMLSDTALTASTITMAGAGGIALGGAVLGTALNPLTTLDLSSSGGSVTQAAGGVVYATTLTSSGNVSGSVDLAGTGNQIANLGALVATTGITLNDDVTTLTVTGAIDGGSAITIANPGSLVLQANLTATGTVALDAVGIAQYSTTAITASVLTGDAGSGYASLGGTNNVQQLGTFGAQAGFGLIDEVASLKVIGPINGGSVGVFIANTGSLVIDAPMTSTGTVELFANGITQDSAGVITAGTLTGDAGTGAAHLGVATNTVTDLDGFGAEQGFGLRDNVPVLTVTSAVDGGIGTYIVNTGSVVIGAPVMATGIVDLVGEGITQTGAGTITAGTLIGNAGTGAANLGVATNDVTNLGAFNAGQGFGLRDDRPVLTVTGAVNGGISVYLVNTGSLALAAPVTATGIVDLVGNGITQDAAGTITAGTLTGDAGTGAAHLGVATNNVTNLGSFTADQGFGLNDSTSALTVTGAVDGGTSVYLVSTGSVAIGAPVTATGIVDLVADGITQTNAGTITAGTLIGDAGAGTMDLFGVLNHVTNLGAVTAAGFSLFDNVTVLTVTGAVQGGLQAFIVNVGSLAIDAPVTASSFIDLEGGPGITQTAAGVISTDMLTGGSTGAVHLGVAVNDVTSLGGFNAGQGIGLRDSVPLLTVTGSVDGGTSVYLVNTGSLAIGGLVTASGLVDLVGNGITQTNAGTITAGVLTGNAGAGAAHLGLATNDVTDLGPFTATQGFGLNDSAPLLTVIGAVNGGTSVYVVNTGSLAIGAPVTATGIVDLVGNGITQYSGGTISADTLTGNAGTGAANLGIATNDVTNLGAFTADQGLGLRDDTPVLTVTGAVNGGTSVYLVNTGSLAINASVAATGIVDLVGNGIAQNAAGTITAGTLMGDAGTGAAHLDTVTNDVTNLGQFTAAQSFALNDGAPVLTVTGAVNGGVDTFLFNTGSLVIAAPVTATDSVYLSGNGIAQTIAGTITAAVLAGSAGTGAANLGVATNDVTGLGAFTAGQGFGLRDDTPLLSVAGTVNGGTAVYLVNTGALAINAPVTATGIVDLVGNDITQDMAGTITAGTLIGDAGTGPARLAFATNDVTNLGKFTAADSFALSDAVPVLTVTGAVNGGTAVNLANTGSLAVDAPITATGTVDLVGAGITQNAAGTITAETLTGDAGAGAAHLGVAMNDVANLGPFTAAAGFGLNDNAPLLTVAGAVNGGTAVYLVNTGSLVLAASVSGTSLVDLVGNGIAQNGGAITTQTLIGNAGTDAADLGGPANMVSDLGPFAASTGFTFNDAVTSTLTVVGAVDGGTGVAITTRGSLAIAAPVMGIGIVDLVAADGISQTVGGVITAGTLIGDAGTGPASLGVATNMVQNLGPFTTPQVFGLRDGVPLLTVVGAISSGPAIYVVNSGSLEINAPLTAADTVDLVADGIGQSSSGVITTATLMGDAGPGAAGLGAATNSVTDLGSFSAGAGLTFNDAVTPTLTVVGAVNGGTGVAITNTGSLLIEAAVSGSGIVDLIGAGITQAGGSITAGTLIGSAGAGAAYFAGPTNMVQNLGPFSALGGFTLTDATPSLTVAGTVNGGPFVTLSNTGSLAIDAPVDATNTVMLTANGISQNGAGVITTGTLTGTAGSGSAELASATSMVVNLGPFTAGGEFQFLDGTGLTVIADVTAGSNAAITVTGAGNALTVHPGITVQATGGSAVLAATGGDLTNDGTVHGGALASLSAGGDIDQHGTVRADNGAVTETAGGAIDHDGASLAPGGSISLAAGGALTQSGSVIAGGNASLTAGSDLTQSNIVTAGADAALTATNGTLTQTGAVTAGNAATLVAGGDLSQIGTVTAAGGDATLTAGGNLTQSNIVTAGGNAALTATNGTLAQNGTVTAGGNANLTATNGTLDQNGVVTAGSSATLVAGADLAQIGTITAIAGNASLTAGGNLTQSNIVTAGADAALTATYGTLTQNGAVTAGGNANLTATNGTLYQNGIVKAGNSATLVAGADLSQIGTVTALGGDATLTAGGNLTQSNIVTAGAGANLTATNGTLTQTGTVTAGGDATLTATNGALNQYGAVTAGNGATLQAGSNLAQAGSIDAINGSASLTAGSTLSQTGAVTAGSNVALTATTGTLDQTGTVRAGGDVTLTAGGNLDQSHIVAAGHDATLTADTGNLMQTGSITAGTSAIIQALAGDVGEAGTVTAPNIQVSAPNGQVSFTGVFAGVQPDPTLNPHFKLTQGTFPSNMSIGAWISGSVITVAPTAQVLGAGGGLSQLVVKLTSPGGTVDFANFQNPLTQLYLDLGTGLASGQIAVDALQVQYVQPGTTQTIDLLGTVNGQSGSTAASASFILPLEKENYQVNGCPIESANCIQITTLTIPVINPLKDLEISTPDQADDILIILPDVGDRDY